MEKELKYASVSGTPSDYDCPDGEIALAANLVPENAALHPVLPPKPVFDLLEGEELLWIHKFKGHTHYIILLTTTVDNATVRTLEWICEENDDGYPTPWARHTIGTIESYPTINSIGRTLIVNDSTGINYYLWTTETTSHYEALGQKPPMLEIKFGLHSDFAVWPDKKNTSSGTGDEKVGGYGGTVIHAPGVKDNIVPLLDADEPDCWAHPKPVMEGGEYDDFAQNQSTYSVENLSVSGDDESLLSVLKNSMTTGVFAAVNKLVNKKGTEENKFVLPFFVRYAYKLYDDSYIMHSYPVLMIPNSRGPVFALDGLHGLRLKDFDDYKVGFLMCGRAYAFISELVYSIASIPPNLSKWKDIITSIDIAVSAPVYTYDQAGTVWGWTNMDGANDWDEYYSISKVVKRAGVDISGASWDGIRPFKTEFINLVTATKHGDFYSYGDYFNVYGAGNSSSPTYKYPSYIATVPQHNISEINDLLASTANYYIIKSWTVDEVEQSGVQSETPLSLDKGTLSGLLGRQRILDDYRTHDFLKASLMHNFNGRINYADVERFPHNPLKASIQLPILAKDSLDLAWQVTVTIKDEMQTITLQGESDSTTNAIDFPRWIFYPDTKAKFAYVKKGSVYYKLKLKPHDYLNGAYWLGDITKQDIVSAMSSISSSSVPDISTVGFSETNKIYTSNVNNPFVFEPTNINTVGTGKILGICTASKALSQGQFGQFPLYAFTDEGVWALETSGTGTYIARQPITRDVCNNPDSITQLDDCVLFTTDRGIMLLSGSTTQCISEILDSRAPFDLTALPNNNSGSLASLVGLTSKTILNFTPAELGIVTPISGTPGPITFKEYLTGARMIYDYVHQRIIVYNPDNNKNYAYVFSLESKQWGMMATNLVSSVNSYPNALAIDSDRHVVDLCGEGDFSNGVDIALITRPFKLDMTDVHKTIDNIIQRGMFRTANNSCQLKQILYGSRDLYNWQLVNSSTNHYMRGFSGTPYKFFRLVVFGKLLHDESLTSASVEYDTRLTNQPR